MKAKYCICKNTYTMDCGDELNCNEDRRELWAQGIGDISAKTTTQEGDGIGGIGIFIPLEEQEEEGEEVFDGGKQLKKE